MQPIPKSDKLLHVGYDVRGPVLDEAERLIQQGHSILQLNTGNPAAFGFTAPQAVLDAFYENAAGAQGYGSSKGLLAAREAIAKSCREKGIPAVTAEDVYTGNGVSEMISICLQALLNTGDEVLVPAPDYPLWTAVVTLCGGKAVHYLCDEAAHWQPDLADLRSKVTSRTRAVVVINPNNPTGVLYENAILQGIAQLARENNLLVFADEIYDTLVMDGKTHTPFAALAPDLFCVTLNGLSKSSRLAGYRAGWLCLCGDKRQAKDYIAGIHMLASMRLCANVPAQFCIPAALENTEPDTALLPGGRLFEQRRVMLEALADIPGVSAVRPDAAFYVFPRLDTARFRIADDERFVLDFLRKHHILFVHGRGFHWPQPDHFRIVYLPEVQQLGQVGRSLKQFLQTYRQN